MRTLLLILFAIILFSYGCVTLTTYEGRLTFPKNIMFNSANFKYIKTISGSSNAIFRYSDMSDKKRVADGLMNTAKANMYKNHTFMPNQIITNISEDIIRTSGSGNSYEVKVVISADVYEFSNNGVFSINNDKKLMGDTEDDDYKEGYIAGSVDVYYVGDKIIFGIEDKLYKGTISKKSKKTDVTVFVDNITERINDKWIYKNSEGTNVHKNYITHYQLIKH